MQPFPSMPGQVSNGFVTDLSAADLSAQMGYVAASPAGNLSIQFFYDNIRIEDPTNPSEHGQYKTVLCVRKRPHGDRHTEAVRMISERAAQQLYPREYAFFKQNQDVPTDGTPLHELPGISQSQVAILVIHGIRCVEDLIGIGADRAGQIGMDARTAYALAVKWTEARAANHDIIRDAAKDAAKDAELERLRASDAEKAAHIAMLSAQVDLLSKMGGGAAQTMALPQGPAGAQMVDADDIMPPASTELFTGAAVVTGNEDLTEDAPPAPSLPGLDRKPRR